MLPNLISRRPLALAALGLMVVLSASVSSPAEPDPADLAITKAASPGVSPGGTISYSISVVNHGPDVATSVVVTDNLPAGTTFVAPSESNSCAAPSPTQPTPSSIRWSFASLANGVTCGISFQATASSSASPGSMLTNQATVSSSAPDPDPTNNTAEASTEVNGPSIVLSKQAAPPSGSTVTPGQTITYTISYENSGNQAATSTVIADQVSSLLTSVSPGPGGSFSSPTVTWNLGTVQPGAAGSVSFSAQAAQSSSGGTISNFATATAANLPGAAQSNTTQHTLSPSTVIWSLTKTSSPSPGSTVFAGDPVTYTISFSNSGNITATNVVITDPVSAFLTAVSPANGGGFDSGSRTITWNVGSVPAGGQGSVSFSAAAAASSSDQTINDQASIKSTETPTPVSSNLVQLHLQAANTSLALAKAASPPSGSSVSPGDKITFFITVTNTSNGKLFGVVITDSVSPLLQNVSVSNGGTFNSGTRTITWSSPPNLNRGTSRTVSFSATAAKVTSPQTVANQASARASGVPQAQSNKTSHTIQPAQVTLTKTSDHAAGSSVKPFDTINYQLSVTESGGLKPTSATVTDSLPAGLDYVPGTTTLDGVAVPDAGGGFPLAGSGVTLALNPGSTRVIAFEARVDVSATPGSALSNTAAASWDSGSVTSVLALHVFRPTAAPSLSQSILVQSPSGQTVLVTVFTRLNGALPVTGSRTAMLALLAACFVGLGASLAARIEPGLFSPAGAARKRRKG